MSDNLFDKNIDDIVIERNSKKFKIYLPNIPELSVYEKVDRKDFKSLLKKVGVINYHIKIYNNKLYLTDDFVVVDILIKKLMLADTLYSNFLASYSIIYNDNNNYSKMSYKDIIKCKINVIINKLQKLTIEEYEQVQKDIHKSLKDSILYLSKTKDILDNLPTIANSENDNINYVININKNNISSSDKLYKSLSQLINKGNIDESILGLYMHLIKQLSKLNYATDEKKLIFICIDCKELIKEIVNSLR